MQEATLHANAGDFVTCGESLLGFIRARSGSDLSTLSDFASRKMSRSEDGLAGDESSKDL